MDRRNLSKRFGSPYRPTRREFVKFGAAAGGGLYLSTKIGGIRHVLHAAIPGGTQSPYGIPKYLTPLLVPPAMPRAGKVKVRGGKNIDYYEIAMRQFQQHILPAGMPWTTVWGYGPNPATVQGGPVIFNAPSLTIEAKWDRPARVKWINELVDANGNYLPHVLPVDQTLHWANPPGGTMHRDTRPAFEATPGEYTGPVPIVTHVHGAVGVGDESDGYAEAWYLPAAANIPAEYATAGTWYNFFKGKANAKYGEMWGPGFATFQYPNDNRASTLWYHDHALGMTRLNVYAGPAGFFIIRGGPSGDGAVLDSRTGTPAVLPGPAPALGDPAGITYFEIPIAIQDRAFNTDGSLFYPDTRAFFDDISGPFLPADMGFSPIWNPEFFGNCLIANGNTWPFHNVQQRRYRFRFPQRLPVALPDPRLQRDPGRRGLAGGQRGRVPRGAGEPHAGAPEPDADGSRRTGGRHRGLHECAAGGLCPVQPRTGRAVRRGCSRRGLRPRRFGIDRAGDAVPRWPRVGAGSDDPASVPGAANDRAAAL
jgi:hypothetical protein